jgi:hypothetical protein
MSIVSRRLIRIPRLIRRLHLVAGFALALPAIMAGGAAWPQAAVDQATAGTQEAIPPPAVSIFPSVTASSQTCLFGCSLQLQNCQNTCISTINGTTVVPSVTSVGTTSNPITCQNNCSSQQAFCSRNCNLVGP